MHRRLLRSLAILALLACPLGCFRPTLPSPPPQRVQPAPPPPKDYYRALPAGSWALRKLPPHQVPDVRPFLTRRHDLLPAIENSLHYLAKPSSKSFFPSSGIGHAQVVGSLEAMRDLLKAGHGEAELAREVQRRFDVYTSIGCDDEGTVLFTGYYTPIFEASRTRTERFRYPLHRPPEGHVKDTRTGKTLGLRQADGSVDPDYPARRALIDSGRLDGRELVYLANAFEAYVIGVQGSARLRLQDGSFMDVAYAGNNGHPYSSLGKALIAQGKLKKEELNLRRLITYFRENPSEFPELAAGNRRYVFFQEGDGAARGCLNEPVIAMRSIATDKSIFPRGGLVMLEADLPVTQGTYRGLALDQDAGGAIRAPGRCDVYMGVGEEAGELAGHTYAEGRVYYLILKDSELFAAR